MDYRGWDTRRSAVHPHDDGLVLGGYDAVAAGGYDAVVSLCRMGRADLGVEHVNVWLSDTTAEQNPNLEFVLADTAELVRQLRSEGKRVLLHCVEGSSRTPSVAARYAVLLGQDPDDVRIGMPVRVTFEAVSEDASIPLFEPAS